MDDSEEEYRPIRRQNYLSDPELSPYRQVKDQNRHRRHDRHRHRRSLPTHVPYPSGNRRQSTNSRVPMSSYRTRSRDKLLDEYTRDIIRRITLSVIIAAGAVCLICIVSKWKEKSEKSKVDSWIEESSFWHDFLYNQFSCSGIGIASVIVALLFV